MASNTPSKKSHSKPAVTEFDRLHEELEDAVRNENFLLAAALRDKIKVLGIRNSVEKNYK